MTGQLPAGALLRGAQGGIRSFLDPFPAAPPASPAQDPKPDAPRVQAPPPAGTVAAVAQAARAQSNRREGGLWMMCRRGGRVVFRTLRPLALPFLHRFEWRIRTAVAKTGVVDAVSRLEATLAERRTEQRASADAALAAQQDLLRLISHSHAAQDTKLQEIASGLQQHRKLARIEGEVTRAAIAGVSDMLRVVADRQVHGEQLASSAGEATRNAVIRLADMLQALADRQTQGEQLIRSEIEAARAAITDTAAKLPTVADAQASGASVLAAWAGFEARVADRIDGMAARIGARADLCPLRAVLPCGDAFLARTPSGWLLAPAADEKLLAAMYETGGCLEPGTTDVITGLLAPGDVALDAGAHIGLLALPAARCVGPQGRVIAVEPTPELVRLLRRSLALNDRERQVVVHECAAGESRSQTTFNIAPVRGHSSLLALDPVAERIEVEVRPLDDLVLAGTPVALAKLDVEGFELRAWRGMRRIIAESPDLAVIVEFGPSHLARAGVTIEAWLAELTAPGFTPYEIDELAGVCRPLRPDGLDEVFSMNLLLLRHPPERFPKLRFA